MAYDDKPSAFRRRLFLSAQLRRFGEDGLAVDTADRIFSKDSSFTTIDWREIPIPRLARIEVGPVD